MKIPLLTQEESTATRAVALHIFSSVIPLSKTTPELTSLKKDLDAISIRLHHARTIFQRKHTAIKSVRGIFIAGTLVGLGLIIKSLTELTTPSSDEPLTTGQYALLGILLTVVSCCMAACLSPYTANGDAYINRVAEPTYEDLNFKLQQDLSAINNRLKMLKFAPMIPPGTTFFLPLDNIIESVENAIQTLDTPIRDPEAVAFTPGITK